MLYVIGEIDNWREFNKEKLKSFEDATSEWMKFQKRLNEANEINEKEREREEKKGRKSRQWSQDRGGRTE